MFQRFDYLDDEAEISVDAQLVSSDESEDEEMDYDRSFVDDGTYLSQDNQQEWVTSAAMTWSFLYQLIYDWRPCYEKGR